MIRFALLSVLMIGAPSAAAKEVLICETEAVRLELTPLTQDTKFICPQIKEAKTLPELYRLGWRLIQYGGNSRINKSNPGVSEMSLVIVMEKD